MVEPTWGAIIIYAINTVLTLIVLLKILSRMPTGGNACKGAKIEWGKDLASYDFSGGNTSTGKNSRGFEWVDF